MPELWSTQIGLVERHWKEKPRKDVIAALIALRTNMMECQHCYEEYTALREQGDVDYLWRIECAKAQKAGLVIRDHPQREWLRSSNRLAYEVLRLDSVLSIFSPDAHTNIEKYLDFELSEFRALYAAADELGLSRGFDTREGTLEPTFKASLEKLDVLIKEHFTPEEIFKAARPR